MNNIYTSEQEILDFFELHDTCYVIHKRLLKIGETGLNICVSSVDKKRRIAKLRAGSSNSCMIPFDGSLNTVGNVYICTKYTFHQLLTKRQTIKVNRKFRDKIQGWQNDVRERLQHHSTEYESLIYKEINKCFNCKVLRQHTFKYGPGHKYAYFFDIYIPHYRIAIEVDGGYHTTEKQQEYDLKRDKTVARIGGIKTFRISNENTQNPIYVHEFIAEIKSYIEKMN